jgi:hypothetical protein
MTRENAARRGTSALVPRGVPRLPHPLTCGSAQAAR